MKKLLKALTFIPHLPELTAILISWYGLLEIFQFASIRIESVGGWEAESIASGIISGHGFSTRGSVRWLWDFWNGNPDIYYPTAWVDPVFTYLLALMHVLFNTYVFHAMYVVNFVCIVIILICLYQIGTRFGSSWIGTLAVALFALNEKPLLSFFESILNSAVAACVLTVLALVSIRYIEKPTLFRLVCMGSFSGFAILTCPTIEYFLLLMPIAIFVSLRNKTTLLKKSCVHAILMFLFAIVVIAPWTIRNYNAFGEFVLVRTGGGQIIWVGTVGTASTFMPNAVTSSVSSPWKANGPYQAVHNMTIKKYRFDVERFQVYSVMSENLEGYVDMNEAQRDSLYMQRAWLFIVQNPKISIVMALVKAEIFTMQFGIFGLCIVVFSIYGTFVSARNSKIWPLTILAVCYCVPFLLVVCYFDRYRAPIEPILVLLASIGISSFVSSLQKIYKNTSLRP